MPETCHTMINAVQEQKNKNCCRKYLRALPRISSISVPCYTSHLPPPIQGDEPGSVDQHTGVCHLCHSHIHRLPLPIGRQRAIVKGRSFFIRRDLRQSPGLRTETLPGSGWYKSVRDLWGIFSSCFTGIVSPWRWM